MTDWDRLRSMRDEEVDLSEIPEVTAHDLREAVLWVGGKPVPEGRSLVGMLLDSDLVEELRKRAGEKGLDGVINETLAPAWRRTEPGLLDGPSSHLSNDGRQGAGR